MHKKEKIWKELMEKIKNAGFKKMIIFQIEQEIVIFEEAQNLKKADEVLSSDEVNKNWEKMINEWVVYYKDPNKGVNIKFIKVPIIFYYSNGKLIH
ncbi:MAG: L-rhamnose mutarotase [Actinobacteria bacterium]|nr:L-rhamnose mutarotase [Actinomycetota bacterium]